jgi:hypothetical protein
MLGAGLVEVRAADRAQPGAVGPAEQLDGQREGQRVARPGAQVEHLVGDVGAAQLLDVAGLVDLAAVDRHRGAGVLQAAHAGPVQRRVEAQPQRVAVVRRARDVEDRLDDLGRDDVRLTAELQRVQADLELEPASLAGGQPQAAEIEAVRACRHALVKATARTRPARERSGARPARA